MKSPQIFGFVGAVLAAGLVSCSGDSAKTGSTPGGSAVAEAEVPAEGAEGEAVGSDSQGAGEGAEGTPALEGPEGAAPAEGAEGPEGQEGASGSVPVEGQEGAEGVEGVEGAEGMEGAEGAGEPTTVDPAEAAQLTADRLACKFKRGALPAETFPKGSPRGDEIPIKHIVIVMQENRSFDHYFSNLPEYGQPDVAVAAADTTNPDEDGTPVARYHETEYCIEDVAHSWNASHIQFNDGKNDGFVVTNNPDGKRGLGYYNETDLPVYYFLANTFAIADHFFCSVMGPTWPNRMYLMAATSFGMVTNVPPPVPKKGPNLLFEILDDAGITWKSYSSDLKQGAMFVDYFFANMDRFENIDRYFEDVKAGNLAQVSFVDPKLQGAAWDRTDEHPPGDLQLGQHFVTTVLQALMDSVHWKDSVLFLTYDEHGGYHDSMPPPKACAPDDMKPVINAGDQQYGFDQYGFRVPFMAISPYSKPHNVSHEVHDNTSILRFIETRFNLPALSARDANASNLLDLFDFESPPAFATPPKLPEAVVDQAKLDRCKQQFAGVGEGAGAVGDLDGDGD